MRVYIAAVILICTFPSCVTMLQPLVTRHNIVIDDRLVGEWYSSDGKIIHIQSFMESKYKPSIEELNRHDYTQADSLFYTKFYVFSYSENNLDYWWFGGLVKINGQYFLNFHPQECLSKSGKENYTLPDQNFIQTYSIAKIIWDKNNKVSLHFFNSDRIRQIILNGNARVKHEYDPLFDNFVITASSSELEQFLKKYGEDLYLYNDVNTKNFTRKE